MSTDDRLQRNNLNHLRDDPQALKKEYDRIVKERAPDQEEWEERQRKLEAEFYRKAGVEPGESGDDGYQISDDLPEELVAPDPIDHTKKKA